MQSQIAAVPKQEPLLLVILLTNPSFTSCSSRMGMVINMIKCWLDFSVTERPVPTEFQIKSL